MRSTARKDCAGAGPRGRPSARSKGASTGFRVLALAAVLAGSLSVASEDIAGPVPARVIEVVDGDTVLVRARIWLGQDVETHVRLLDLDAPELKGRCAAERERARQAKAFLESWLGDGAVELRDIRFDKYGGRVLARIVRGGQDVAAAMIAAGLGRPYDGRRRAPWCADQQG